MDKHSNFSGWAIWTSYSVSEPISVALSIWTVLTVKTIKAIETFEIAQTIETVKTVQTATKKHKR